jgi:hypothetical protein
VQFSEFHFIQKEKTLLHVIFKNFVTMENGLISFRQNIVNGNGAGGSRANELWMNLWKSNTPVKIKIFGWRTIHGIIPCLGLLANRHVPVSRQCSFCSSGFEDLLHMLFLCP